ncbi:hypothetical protein F341_154 [Campylobacter phage F341]|uniref:Uncharacterized protein n=3 Tax=Fletchervirus TaxID=1636618 RepID=A0AAF0JZY8_9CAUD|nr:hypothetical protein NCTC12673_gp065 [Campylobacter phage NCTC12673]YP_009321721.1 hypothetical protein BOX06_gp122 [Campylobacter phage PC14]AVR55760.1 hypothetical protein [Campylobacter phage CP39]WGA02355.1 hypothetical protein [Campylobacter phage vB_Cj_QDYZ]WJZ70254.1 hypothetical protein F341_154 [Campylobacter phage F341]AEA86411.1 hypothetical protein [Campylobacter phage NCTC12673]ANH51414.1 hypothetical protein PC14_00121 [Campylobacter phage PC14]
MYTKYLYESSLDLQFEVTDQDFDESFLNFNKELPVSLSETLKLKYNIKLSLKFQSKYDDIGILVKLNDNGKYVVYSNSIENIDKFIIFVDTLNQNKGNL